MGFIQEVIVQRLNSSDILKKCYWFWFLAKGLTFTSPLKESLRVYSQVSSQSVSKVAKLKEIISKIKNYCIRPKHCHYRT